MPQATPKIVPLKSLRVLPDRGRKVFNGIMELAGSIKSNGIISPLYVTDGAEPGTYTLVAGERRYRASVLAGLKEVPVLYRDGLTELQQKIVELEENVGREDLTWQEEAELHRQIDEAKKKENPDWTQKQTAELVQLTPGAVSLQINIAKKLKEDPTLKEEIRNLDIRSAMKVIDARERVQRVERLQSQGKIKLTTDFQLGSCLSLIRKLETHSVDLLLTDPPYGVEALEELRQGTGKVMPGHATLSDTHNMNLPEVLELLRNLAPELHRVLKPGAHMYIFCAFQYVGDFVRALKPFEFQPPLLIWDRGRTTAPGYGYNYLNRTEAIIYGHNPPRTKRLQKNMFNVLEEPGVTNAERVSPFEKPQGLLKTLIQQSSIINDLVLDPFACSASTLRAARSLGRRSIGFEINEDSWKLGQLALQGGEERRDLFAEKD